MMPADGDAPGGRPATGGRWTTASAVLLLLAAMVQIGAGVAAISGVGTLRDNVRQIESDPHFGDLYLSLQVWGVLLVLVGIGGAVAARSLAHRGRNARVLGLAAALLGLAIGLLTLAIFRAAALAPVALAFAALYVLSYRVEG